MIFEVLHHLVLNVCVDSNIVLGQRWHPVLNKFFYPVLRPWHAMVKYIMCKSFINKSSKLNYV